MSRKIKDRHLLGTGAAACAVCCAPPLLALLGIAGAGLAATAAALAFAGLAFGTAVLAGALFAGWARRRAVVASICALPEGSAEGPVDVTISARTPEASPGRQSGR